MNPLSMIIRDAHVIDGTGKPGFRADVAIAGDRIAEVAPRISAEVPIIDAGGHVLAPGFIEVHTHYDPQICWDRLATPTLEHGTTTIGFGNCSLSLAPVHRRDIGHLTRTFSKIEDISSEFFDAAVPYSWQTFPEFLDYIRPGLGPNVSGLVGHSALRHYVMGEAAQQRAATDAELDRMCGILGESLQAGALGLSLSYADSDENGMPVASCFADVRERIALARTVVDNGRRLVQSVREFLDPAIQAQQVDEQAVISLASGALCATSPILDQPLLPGKWREDLLQLERLQRAGAQVVGQASMRPIDFSFSLSRAFFVFYIKPAWADIMLRPLAERRKLLGERSRRAKLAEEADSMMMLMRGITVGGVVSERNQQYVGRHIVDIAKDERKHLADALIDIALEDELETEFSIRNTVHADVDIVGEIITHPHIQIAASDAGAHVAQFSGNGDCPFLIEQFVRRHKKMTLESAIKRMTSEIADAVAIKDRGIIAKGKFADLVLFNPQTIARGEEKMIYDLPPNGGGRFMRHPSGIDRVIVNGQVVVEQGKYSDARSGRIV